MKYSDDELLKLVGEERKRSIGFGEGDNGELTSDRERALNYHKGLMTDVPSLSNRSAAVDTTVADAIETVLPDVLEILIGGDDVATFIPQGEDDEEKAQEESDYVTHVVMVENEGFLNAYTVCKDALLVRTGIFYWYWEETEKDEPQATLAPEQAHLADMAIAVAGQMGQQLDGEEQDDGSVNLTQTKKYGKVCIRAVPPEDFTVAPDTTSLRDATYCAMRDRPRVQDLIARGVDPEKARALKAYQTGNDAINQARDEAGETNQVGDDGFTSDLRIVETRAHFIRLLDDDGDLTVYRVVTDGEETVLLEEPEEVGQITFAAITPYMIPHRFYGESVADKLIEVQKIKTAILRMFLDSGYFALNQRNEVADQGTNDYTMSDLLRNEPGVPVRVKMTGTVVPISAGQLNFDSLAALEYASTMAESRSGIVRNAQGLNPDTLHDTAKGALALMGAAQRRTRMIARIFAETGFKDLYLGVHRMLRSMSTTDHAPANAKLKNAWKTIKPCDWCERNSVTIHVGVGSGGKDHDLAVATQRLELAQPVVMEQGGLNGPLLTADNLHAMFSEWERAAGSKKVDQFWTDPAGPNAPKPQPKPDPAMAKVQGDQQIAQAKAQSEAQLSQAKAQADAQLAAQKHQNDLQAATAKAQQDHALSLAQIQADAEANRYKTDQELQLKRETNAAELQLKRELLTAELEMKRQEIVLNAQMKQQTPTGGVSEVQPGGQPG